MPIAKLLKLWQEQMTVCSKHSTVYDDLFMIVDDILELLLKLDF